MSKRQKYPAAGLPTVYMAYVFEDWDLAGKAADALGTYGVDICCEWSSARLFSLKEKDAELLRYKLGEPYAWLVAVISEQTKDVGPLEWVMELARETMDKQHYAVLPVRYESVDWNPPPTFASFPRVEARGNDLVVVWPDSTYQLPLRRWFRVTTNG